MPTKEIAKPVSTKKKVDKQKFINRKLNFLNATSGGSEKVNKSALRVIANNQGGNE